MSDLFERASRERLRFPTLKGLINTEDLWVLPLKSKNGLCLNSIAQGVSKAQKEVGEEDFVGGGNAESKLVSLAMDVVKHVIAVRLAENKAKSDSKANASHNEEIDEIIAAKKLDEKKSMTVEELEKLKM